MTEPLAAITAAGASSRLGCPKALLTLGGCSFLERIASALSSAGVEDLVVVLGAEGERLVAEVERIGAEPLMNPDWERGRFTSIRAAAARAGRRRLLLWPVDCPAVRPDTVVRLLGAAEGLPDRDLVPVHDGRGGHPVLLSRASVEEIQALPDDANLRDVVARRREAVAVEDPGVLDDVDDWGAYDALLARGKAAHG